MALKTGTKNKNVVNVVAQRTKVATLIEQALATEATLIAAERSLDTLDSATAAYAAV